MITNGLPIGNTKNSLLPKDPPGVAAKPPDGIVQAAADPVSQGDIAALSSAGHMPAVHDDFKPGARNPDDSYAALAGLLPALRVTIPRSKAEQQARDALESTLRVIDDMAAALVEQGNEVLKSGTSAQQFAVAAAIDRFLQKAESAMKGLIDVTVKELPPPQSPAMQKLVELMGDGMWRDIEKMQKEIEKTFETPLPGNPGNARPDAAQRQQFARHYAELNAQNFLAQLGAVNLPAIRKLDFDARNLSGMAALREELEAVAELASAARSARVAPAAGNAAAASLDVGKRAAAEPDSEDESDLENQEDEQHTSGMGLDPLDLAPPAARRDR